MNIYHIENNNKVTIKQLVEMIKKGVIMISLLPRPKIPPYSFFEPISVEPKDWMTSTEFLMGILKKIDEVVIQTNSNTKFIDEYNGKIEEIEADLFLSAEIAQTIVDSGIKFGVEDGKFGILASSELDFDELDYYLEFYQNRILRLYAPCFRLSARSGDIDLYKCRLRTAQRSCMTARSHRYQATRRA